ncbi:hypothetical protein TRIUR3_13645 [Triticum urartu]|uniref:Uncharacterized protein n=1 Tax=Triticum urartu TaxID=4572 RepID=M7ZMI8_TRIUA|nr:hypothetical protein TRIUR3_13645 [Triticum urartu]
MYAYGRGAVNAGIETVVLLSTEAARDLGTSTLARRRGSRGQRQVRQIREVEEEGMEKEKGDEGWPCRGGLHGELRRGALLLASARASSCSWFERGRGKSGRRGALWLDVGGGQRSCRRSSPATRWGSVRSTAWRGPSPVGLGEQDEAEQEGVQVELGDEGRSGAAGQSARGQEAGACAAWLDRF